MTYVARQHKLNYTSYQKWRENCAGVPILDGTGRKGKGRINAREYRASMFAHYHAGLEIAAVPSGFRLFDLGFVGVHTKRIGAKLATSQRVTNHYFLSERSEAEEGLF